MSAAEIACALDGRKAGAMSGIHTSLPVLAQQINAEHDTKWPPGPENGTAPPDQGRAEGKGNNIKCSCKYNEYPPENQGPRHIGEIAAKVFLDTCEQQILRQIEKLTNPTFDGASRIEAQEYLAGLLVAYEETAGRPWSLEVAA